MVGGQIPLEILPIPRYNGNDRYFQLRLKECDCPMYKRFFLPLMEAEARIKEYRCAEEWKQLRNITIMLIAAFLVMSVINLFQQTYVMLATTLGSAAVLALGLRECWAKKNSRALEWLYLLLFMALCTYYILSGGNEGFSILWVVFVPSLFALMIDTVKGIALSTYFLLLLFLVFYGPLDFLLRYDYSAVIRLRFPVFYAINYCLSVYCATQLIWTRSDLILAQRQAREASFLDAATGLKNRTAFTHFMQAAHEQNFIRLTVIYIDVNGLHELNNRLGHAAGDEMLRFIAGACVERFPKADIFRLGGDEFLIACSVGTEGEIRLWMEELVRTIESAGYTIAYGIEYRLHDFDLEDMVNSADAKMLKNKADYYKAHNLHQR